MREQSYRIAGSEVKVYFVETREDTIVFEDWHSRQILMGLDTETTGLNTFGPEFEIRTVQFGSRREAYVLRTDQFRDVIKRVLTRGRYVLHNSAFDNLALDRFGYIDLDEFFPRCDDTYTLAHLNDPRERSKGGTGLALKDISKVLIDPEADDGQKLLYAEFHKIGKTKDTGWSAIDVENPVYWGYGGLDTILTLRLYDELIILVRELGCERLYGKEMEIRLCIAKIQRRGCLIDVDYTQRLSTRLEEDAAKYVEVAKRYGVQSVNSPKQIVEALLGMGETLTVKTDSGALSASGEALLPLADLDSDYQRIGARDANPLAEAIIFAKRAGKWGTTYAQKFLDLRDANDRLHAGINPLQARTGRMSIDNPSMQNLPAKGWMIRRSIIADPGNIIVAADYKAMELRVLAGLANVAEMKRAIQADEDLHDFTASLIYGPGFTKKQRKIAKGVGLGKVFGGGAPKLSLQTGAPLEEVTRALKAYDAAYPEVRRFSNDLQRKAKFGKSEVITPSGRHLPVDRDRSFSVVNYMVQSTARDIMAAALLRIEKAGLGDYVLLPVHDEVIAQAPKEDAEDVAQAISEAMRATFRGVPIDTDAAVYGSSWGGGYVGKDDTDTEWQRLKDGIALPEGY